MNNNFVLGTVQLGLDYGISNSAGKPSIIDAFKILDSAIDNNITIFDTANAYGNSESIIGDYLKEHKRTVDIITKVPPITDSFSMDKLYDYFTESLENLSVNRVYGLMFHSFDDFYDNVDDCISFFKDIRSKNLVTKTGVSIYTPEQAIKLLEFDEVDIIQIPMNVFSLEMYYNGILEKFNNHNIEYHVRSIFLQGLFFMDDESIKRKLPMALSYIEELNKYCKIKGVDRISFIMSVISKLVGKNGRIVFGVDSPDQIEYNIKMFNGVDIANNDIDFLVELSNKVPKEIKNPALWI